MRCVVTAGPTYEPLDNVRRLTNFSTGRLGTELARFLAGRGHEVTLLVGQQATYHAESCRCQVETFTTTADLRDRLHALAEQGVDGLFHAAAVADFSFGQIFERSARGKLTKIVSGKISTRHGRLLAELVPTPKIIADLRGWFPKARLVGWKYEVDGRRPDVIRLAELQLTECRTDACVANGPAYGSGFGLVTGAGKCAHLASQPRLFEALDGLIR